MHGKARHEASGLQASSHAAIALLVRAVPAVLSVALVCRDERDDLLPPADVSAHVRGCAVAGDLPRL
jgi:hypothetical protein